MKVIAVGGESAKLRSLINLATRDAIAVRFARWRGEHDRARQLAARARLGLRLVSRSSPPPSGMLAQLVRLLAEAGDGDVEHELSHEVATANATLDASGIDVVDLDVFDLDLPRVNLERARIRKCRLRATSLAQSRLDDCMMVECDLARSSFQRTSWRRAMVVRTKLDGAVLWDACLESTLFVECSLRGADLSADKLGPFATMAGARFLRCDLRETRWDGRSLRAVRIADCKLFGAHGTPTLDGLTVHRIDLSAAGDGSQPATLRDVRGWRRW